MQTCFLQQLMPISSLARLAENLQAKRIEREQWLQSNDLKQIYLNCDVPPQHWNLLTNLLEKLAIVKAAGQ